jgi:hypothetical protein
MQTSLLQGFILSSVSCLALPYFSTLSKKCRIFEEKNGIENKTCVLIFSTNPV